MKLLITVVELLIKDYLLICLLDGHLTHYELLTAFECLLHKVSSIFNDLNEFIGFAMALPKEESPLHESYRVFLLTLFYKRLDHFVTDSGWYLGDLPANFFHTFVVVLASDLYKVKEESVPILKQYATLRFLGG